ncbi:nucleoside-triphosphatase [Lachnospiraceae bacterium 54-53]
MGNFLFLTGNSGEGKTTLLFECLKPLHESMGGFYTQRLINEAGSTMGFRMVPASEEWAPKAPYKKGLSNVFMEQTEGGFQKNLEVFETVGTEILLSSVNTRLCLMDEIGGIELAVPGFIKAVLDCMDHHVPCIGVLKSRRNLAAMSSRIPVLPEADQKRVELEAEIMKRAGGQVHLFERAKTETVRGFILDFLKENTEK